MLGGFTQCGTDWIDTFAMVSFTGDDPEWVDPDLADWPTSSLLGNSYLQGHKAATWIAAVLQRMPTARYAYLGTSPSQSVINQYDIATWQDGIGLARVNFNYEALEHLLSMIKWVVVQHKVPPKTMLRIMGRSKIGTKFGLFINFEAYNANRAYTRLSRPLVNCLVPYTLEGTRANAYGCTQVDADGAHRPD